MVYITRRERFSAAHMLKREEWSEGKNMEVFGKCSNPNWHGHNYELFVTVKGEPSPETGFVSNLSDISTLIHERVIKYVDHKNLNIDVPFLEGKLSSTENVAIAIWEQLQPEIDKLDCVLHCVKLQETENNYVEYYGS